MVSGALRIGSLAALLVRCNGAWARTADGTSLRPSLVQGTLIEPGSRPFYLQGVITERSDPNERVEVEMSWVSLDKWSRTIHSPEFSQTLIVNGERVFEQDSADYFSLAVQTLVTAMVDPGPVLDAFRPG